MCHNVFFISDLWSIAKIDASSGSLGILEAPAIAVLARLEPGGWHQTTTAMARWHQTSAWWPLEEKRSAIVPTLSWAMLQIHARPKKRCTILVIDYEQFWKDCVTTTQRNTGNLLNPVDALRHYAQSPKLSSAEPWQILFMPRWQSFHQLTCLKIGTSVGPTILVSGGLLRMGWFLRFAAGLLYFQWGLRDRIGQFAEFHGTTSNYHYPDRAPRSGALSRKIASDTEHLLPKVEASVSQSILWLRIL